MCGPVITQELIRNVTINAMNWLDGGFSCLHDIYKVMFLHVSLMLRGQVVDRAKYA